MEIRTRREVFQLIINLRADPKYTLPSTKKRLQTKARGLEMDVTDWNQDSDLSTSRGENGECVGQLVAEEWAWENA